jgi:hypothetical protein
MVYKRSFVFAVVFLALTLSFTALVFAQEATPAATPDAEATQEPLPSPDFALDAEATLDPSMVFVTPLQSDTVVNVRRGPGIQNRVRGVLRPSRYLEAIGYNGFDLDRTCSEDLQNDLDMWIQVRFNEGEAWVARCVVVVVGNLSNLPAVVDLEATQEAALDEDFSEPLATPEATQES